MNTRHARLAREIVLYSDVDGTLLSGSRHVAPQVIREIERFVRQGFGFTLATGRSRLGAQSLIQSLPVNTPVVLCNGAYVYDVETGEAWWAKLDVEALRGLMTLLLPLAPINVYLERHDQTLWVTNPDILRDRFVQEELLRPQLFRDVEEVLAGGDVMKLGVKVMTDDPSVVSELCQKIIQCISRFSNQVDFCFSSDAYLEVTPKGVSKWTGIIQSQAMRGTRDALIFAVGDHHNDVEMIRHADAGFAMGNAVREVKQVAKYTIGSVSDHAVGKLLMDIRSSYNTLPLTT